MWTWSRRRLVSSHFSPSAICLTSRSDRGATGMVMMQSSASTSMASQLARRGRAPRIANIKGVLGDAVRFEHGLTQASMALQARWEAGHARRADLVVTTSHYCKDRLRELYGFAVRPQSCRS